MRDSSGNDTIPNWLELASVTWDAPSGANTWVRAVLQPSDGLFLACEVYRIEVVRIVGSDNFDFYFKLWGEQ